MAEGFYWTAHLAESGELYLGGISGFTVFHPDSLQEANQRPRMVLTNFRLFNQTVPMKGSRRDTLAWGSPLSQSITFTESITLKHWQNYFSLEFSALDFTAPATNRYRYQLEGYREEWVYTDADRRFVTYTNLSPGTYTFRVQGATRNGPWSDEAATLQIHILSPWWKTVWAYLIYALAAFLVIRTIYLFHLKRQLAQAETDRLKELDAAKSHLFANVTHEFRTPLTVILGMTQQIKAQPKGWLHEGLDAIQRNGQQLLRLVNQMLDLSRLEVGNLPIEYQQGEVMSFLAYLVQSFQSFAESKEIELQFEKKVDTLEMDVAPDMLSKIIQNLVSNALKFTPPGGSVKVVAEKHNQQLIIQVSDTGMGIAAETLPHIFDRFFQADPGNNLGNTRQEEGMGIGLALVKELTEALEGTIQVMSIPNSRTVFTLNLPIKNKAPKASLPLFEPLAPVAKEGHPRPTTVLNAVAPLVLIIEDNLDVSNYIASCLQYRYRLDTALNGRIGIEKALEKIPDLIICDVMMPEVNDYEVCHTLKNDERTSHIPIVMLTAKADDQSRLEGLQRGADAYLIKPFNREEINIRLAKLHELRQKLQARFAHFPAATSKTTPVDSEDAFLQKLRTLVLNHLSDEIFGIPEVCKALNISRSQLHRKLTALTGRSTSRVIRSIRLQKAKELLLQSSLNISEIAYQTGFKTHSHFTTVFTEAFGQSPTELRDNPLVQ